MTGILTTDEKHAFGGTDWSKYMAYRPAYPGSFFKRIYDYHGAKPQASWSKAHDVGAGAGIVSATLAPRFDNVIMSDPNDGYAALGHKILVEDLRIPKEKLSFLQESAEKSSVESGTIDLIAACEMLHWTDSEAAVDEFHRQLKIGGTVVITWYTWPKILGKPLAQTAWDGIFATYWEEFRPRGNLYVRAQKITNCGYESVQLPEEKWKEVKRVYINARGTLDAFKLDGEVGESKVGGSEEKIWVEGDKDWMNVKGIDWFKAYFNTTCYPCVPEERTQHLWQQLEGVLGEQAVAIETPVVMIFGTKA
ncbi:S-adenosyl-L-methionine-dependent methyltransferase [Xylaria arbuscula]|nr:S-adenosyl-L-methionine-dependent methyltransferase [Xylaria arbuscula]